MNSNQLLHLITSITFLFHSNLVKTPSTSFITHPTEFLNFILIIFLNYAK